MTEKITGSPEEMYGRLSESIHMTGYTFQRACQEFEYLLDDDRWRQIGSGFEDIDDFLKTIDFSEFKIPMEKRKKISRKLSDLRATQRAAAKALGVGVGTVNRDLDPDGTKPEKQGLKSLEKTEDDVPNGTKPPPAAITQSGQEAAKAAEKAARKKALKEIKEIERKEKRAADAENAGLIIDPKDDYGIICGDFREVAEEIPDDSVSLIFTDPPYDRQSLRLYGDMAEIAARKLCDGGSLVTYFGQYQLEEVLGLMSSHLRFWWQLAVIHTGRKARMREYGVVVHWKPLLWFVKKTREDKETFIDDLIVSEIEKDFHPWQQSLIEARYYIDKLCPSDGMVFDPFCGGGTTPIACIETGRKYLSCDINHDSVVIARGRVHDTQVS
jgi:hypothetical protein